MADTIAMTVVAFETQEIIKVLPAKVFAVVPAGAEVKSWLWSYPTLPGAEPNGRVLVIPTAPNGDHTIKVKAVLTNKKTITGTITINVAT
jgi:hypothetical protein